VVDLIAQQGFHNPALPSVDGQKGPGPGGYGRPGALRSRDGRLCDGRQAVGRTHLRATPYYGGVRLVSRGEIPRRIPR